MKRQNNYQIQANQAKARFLTYDQAALIDKFCLKHDKRYLYPTLFSQPCRLDRTTGSMERLRNGAWVDAGSHGEIMTMLDLLCDSRPDRFLTGRVKTMQNFGLMFHQDLLEGKHDPHALLFDREPERLRRGCAALGGIPVPGADIAYRVELFDGLCITVQFWHGDEEFAPRLRYLWDENALMYLRYETMYFAVGLLLDRIREV